MMLEQELREIGLTGIQYTVLAIVGTREGVSSAELSRRFFVTPQTMNEIVTGMEKRGLLARQPSERNRRVLVAELTAEGRRLLDAADTIADGVETAALDGLTDRDFEELRRIVGGLLAGLRGRSHAGGGK